MLTQILTCCTGTDSFQSPEANDMPRTCCTGTDSFQSYKANDMPSKQSACKNSIRLFDKFLQQ